ncbi:MAG: P-loop NTPase [Candidatus Marinimicrobia bacterium]|jgi:ATP-binding protein involved in chromosome partitioning|nr:P-loop NTPase [Candidatus Neomarinimicrobiota bacterium]MDP6594051.1 P-loop NTPase [Candidatus Neomarinimicrobiota bacterium]MDP6836560.1 P-loop NTPase [Candidatus Neomarinimicrobiota bacterium]|tara:strand:- start:326 stop:1477 length:1152 start_codon:yes stop_codon:yes gene_type:complete
MNEDNVIELLKTVNYPGFSRDIVSFGLVKGVEIEDGGVVVELQVSTGNEDNKQEIRNRVQAKLKESRQFDKIDVHMNPVVEYQEAQSPGAEPPPPVSLPGVKYTVAVASGKGGVGKSTVATNLAAQWASQGYKVGLLDLDIYGPSLPILLGINERPDMTPEKKLIPLQKYGMNVMSLGFISGNETPVIWRGPMVARMTEQFFTDVLWQDLDFLVLDLPPGTGDVQLTLVQKLKISGAIIVTTPQDLAVSDVRKSADMFGKVNTLVLGVIENMAGYLVSGIVRDGEGQPVENATVSFAEMDGFKEVAIDEKGKFEVGIDLFKRGGGVAESERLHVSLLGEIPISRELIEACDEGVPLVVKDPNSSVSQLFASIAGKVEQLVQNE